MRRKGLSLDRQRATGARQAGQAGETIPAEALQIELRPILAVSSALQTRMLPLTIGAAGGSACTDKAGCAAIAVRKADGSLWYSGGWRLTGREQ